MHALFDRSGYSLSLIIRKLSCYNMNKSTCKVGTEPVAYNDISNS